MIFINSLHQFSVSHFIPGSLTFWYIRKVQKDIVPHGYILESGLFLRVMLHKMRETCSIGLMFHLALNITGCRTIWYVRKVQEDIVSGSDVGSGIIEDWWFSLEQIVYFSLVFHLSHFVPGCTTIWYHVRCKRTLSVRVMFDNWGLVILTQTNSLLQSSIPFFTFLPGNSSSRILYIP